MEDFNKCCRGLLFAIEQGLEYNTLKAKLLSPNFRYKHVAYVLENYLQIRSKLSVLLSEKTLY